MDGPKVGHCVRGRRGAGALASVACWLMAALALEACGTGKAPEPGHLAPDNPCEWVTCSVDGTCMTQTLADGTACAAATPCQAAGTCSQGACVRAPATPLPQAWAYQSDAGTIWFYGVVD